METNKLAYELLKRGFKESDLKGISHREELSPRQTRKLVKRARSMQALYSKENVIIGRMTNFQRLQWQRAGSPRDMEGLLFFSQLTKEFFDQLAEENALAQGQTA